MAAVDHAAHPPVANQSSRVDARTLGMFLFIASEIMLFGSFFTIYFFVRVSAGTPWPTPPNQLPVFVAGMNTIILVTSSFTMHWALQSIKRGNRSGLKAGLESIRFMPSTTGGRQTHIACSAYEHGMFRGDWLLYGKVVGGKLEFEGLFEPWAD